MLKKIFILLMIIGAVNWGLVGTLGLDIVAWLCGGSTTAAARVIYCAVGVSGLLSLPLLFSGGDRQTEKTSAAQQQSSR